jgi:hypothetical protein
MFINLGAYGDTGGACLPLMEGAPRPDIPETLLWFEPDVSGGRSWLFCWIRPWLWV